MVRVPNKLERGQTTLPFLSSDTHSRRPKLENSTPSLNVQSRTIKSPQLTVKKARPPLIVPDQVAHYSRVESENARPTFIVPGRLTKSTSVDTEDAESSLNDLSQAEYSSATRNYRSVTSSLDISGYASPNTSISEYSLSEDGNKSIEPHQFAYYLTDNEKSHFQYPKFAGYINYILFGHMVLAESNSVYMKNKVKHFLRGVDRIEFLTRAIGFIPHNVQAALNGERWEIRDLLWGNFTHMTGRKGCYFGAGFNKKDQVKPVGYGGQARGMSGLLGRVSNHLSSKYRQKSLISNRPKCLYQWVAGLIDGHTRNLEFAVFAYFHFLPNENEETRVVICDIMESIMITLLGLFDISEPMYGGPQIYAKLAPPGFKCTDSIIGTNRIGPCEHFGQVRGASIEEQVIDESVSSWEREYEVKYEKHTSLPVFTAYILFSPLVKIQLSMKVLQRFRVKENDKITLRFDLWHADTAHPNRYIQESVPDIEAREAHRLGIEVTGGTDDTIWSFWLRRNTDGKDWKLSRPTSNHVGIATAMTILDDLRDKFYSSVPSTRLRLSSNDAEIVDSDGPFLDLTNTFEYDSRVTYRARDYTAVMDGIQLHMSRESFEMTLANVCVCDLHQFDCNAKSHTHKVPLFSKAKIKPRFRLDLEYPCPRREEIDCPYTFKDSNKAHQHASNDHPELAAEKTIQCTIPGCERTFAKIHHLERHLAVAHTQQVSNSATPEVPAEASVSKQQSSLISSSDGDMFTTTAQMSGRWIDNGEAVPYAWKDIIGMILLDHKLAGNSDGLDYDEIVQKIQDTYSFFAAEITPQQRLGGWPLSIQRVLKKEETFFVKRGKDDRSLVGNKRKDKWIILEAKEDDFINPNRNLTRRARKRMQEDGYSGADGKKAKST